MGKFPVTQAQWQAVMNNNPSSWKGENLPVESLSWNDTVEFCQRLSRQTGRKYRLPHVPRRPLACPGSPLSDAASVVLTLYNN